MAISGWLPESIPKCMTKLLPTESVSEYHSLSKMARLLEDESLDFPVARVKDANEDQSNIFTAVKDANKEQVLPSAKDTMQSEYEELVQSYWKKVEVSTRKRMQHGFGSFKSKSVTNAV